MLTTTVSVLALGISGLTAWLTLFRRGTIKMSQPTTIFFGWDGQRQDTFDRAAKVFLRTLLFSTSKKGRIVESMHLMLSRDGRKQNFAIWVYGDEKLVRGSGLFVGETGVAANHHFLLPHDTGTYRFSKGLYGVELYAHLLGEKGQQLLFKEVLEVTEEFAFDLRDPTNGLYFDWMPDTSRYVPHLHRRNISPPSVRFDP